MKSSYFLLSKAELFDIRFDPGSDPGSYRLFSHFGIRLQGSKFRFLESHPLLLLFTHILSIIWNLCKVHILIFGLCICFHISSCAKFLWQSVVYCPLYYPIFFNSLISLSLLPFSSHVLSLFPLFLVILFCV